MTGRSEPSPRVSVAQGDLVGLTDRGVHLFRGVPYAQPPVGALRWTAPQPPQGWSGVRDATRFGDVAPQAVRPGLNFQTKGESEDCLYLNVATPTLDDAAKQPVMVWIHGGGNLYGAASDPLYDPVALALRGVTLVSFNYRLGVFGFLAHPLFGANFAVLDYLAALAWVRDNISAFGGDPANVTIFGQSAGAVATRTLLACPLAAGLFHRVMIQSAGFEAKATGEWWSREKNETAATELFTELGTQDPDALRAMPTERIMAAAANISGARDRPGLIRTPAQLVWMPIIDDEVVVADGYPAWTPEVTVMLGTVANEARFFIRPERQQEFDEALVGRMARELTGPAAEQVLRHFAQTELDPYAALDALVTTTVFTEPASETARRFAELGREFYVYRFERLAPGAIASGFLASHACELPYLFGTLFHAAQTPYLFAGHARADWYNARDVELADALQQAWVSFARDGAPQSDGMAWPKYRAGEAKFALIGNTIIEAPADDEELQQIVRASRVGQPSRSWLGSTS